MPNTKSAEKALRNSAKKRSQNLFWKKRIKKVVKEIKEELSSKSVNKEDMTKKLMLLQKYVDKAAKNNVIHKNKANSIKSTYASKISAHAKESPSAPDKEKPTKGKRKPSSKSSK